MKGSYRITGIEEDFHRITFIVLLCEVFGAFHGFLSFVWTFPCVVLLFLPFYFYFFWFTLFFSTPMIFVYLFSFSRRPISPFGYWFIIVILLFILFYLFLFLFRFPTDLPTRGAPLYDVEDVDEIQIAGSEDALLLDGRGMDFWVDGFKISNKKKVDKINKINIHLHGKSKRSPNLMVFNFGRGFTSKGQPHKPSRVSRAFQNFVSFPC